VADITARLDTLEAENKVLQGVVAHLLALLETGAPLGPVDASNTAHWSYDTGDDASRAAYEAFKARLKLARETVDANG
jgi:hypothetical protein